MPFAKKINQWLDRRRVHAATNIMQLASAAEAVRDKRGSYAHSFNDVVSGVSGFAASDVNGSTGHTFIGRIRLCGSNTVLGKMASKLTANHWPWKCPRRRIGGHRQIAPGRKLQKRENAGFVGR